MELDGDTWLGNPVNEKHGMLKWTNVKVEYFYVSFAFSGSF